MADDILNLSLDDIIKRNAEKTHEKRVARGEKRELGPRKDGIRKVAQGAVTKTVKAVPIKAQKEGRPGPRRERVPPETARRNELIRRAALDGDSKWQHDKFQEVAGAAPRRTVGGRSDNGATKLVVSNLDFHVSEDDLTELFGSCGRLKRVKIIYDRSGRSEGIAEVVFEVGADAEKAKRQYNGALLDGKPMQLEVQPLNGTSVGVKTLSSGIRIQVGTGSAAAGTSNGAGPSRTNLQLPRTFVQATTSNAPAPAARPVPRQEPRSRMQSRVVRGRGTVTTDFMEE